MAVCSFSVPLLLMLVHFSYSASWINNVLTLSCCSWLWWIRLKFSHASVINWAFAHAKTRRQSTLACVPFSDACSTLFSELCLGFFSWVWCTASGTHSTRRVREARVRSTLLVEAHLWHLIMHYLLPTTRMPLSFSLGLVSCTVGRWMCRGKIGMCNKGWFTM
jgi:hypothetical protein